MATIARRAPQMQPGISWNRITLHFVLIVGAIFMIMPFLAMVSTSLKTQKEILTEFPPKLIPDTLAFSNYTTTWTPLPFDCFYISSLLVARPSAIVDALLPPRC